MKCGKNTESKNPKVEKSIKTEECFYQNVQCAILKKMKFSKKQEARELLSKLTGIKEPILSNLPIANNLF